MGLTDFMENFHHSALSAHEKGERIIDLLESIEQGVHDQAREVRNQNISEFRRIPQQGVADATGVCDLTYRIHPGISYTLVSLAATGSPAGASTGVFVYLGDASNPMNLIWVMSYAQFCSDDFSASESAPPGSVVTVRFVGQTPGQVCTASLKVEFTQQSDTEHTREV